MPVQRCQGVPQVETVLPEQLWECFISQRLPVLVQTLLQDESWKASERWTEKYLRTNAV